MITLGAILAVIGWVTGLGVLLWAGAAFVVLGLVFIGLGGYGHPVGGRRYWW